jgi:hypothetical protein
MSKKFFIPKSDEGRKITSPVKSEETSAEQLPPIFSLKINKDYCITRCDKNEKAAFADRLHELSQSTWRDLRQAGRHGQGYEKIDRSDIKGTIPAHVTEDVNIIAFRFSGLKPMAGYRDIKDRRIFHIVWLDKDFTLYKH